MSAELITYPLLFITIFFESFILVTLLSKPARQARARLPGTATPRVAVIVPCYNEAATVGGTCESLLALEYPKDKLEIILVNDGSTDATPAVMERFAQHPQVRIIHKENGGKYTALNAGIRATDAELVGCLDADSFVEPDALRELLPFFSSDKVAAVTAAMSAYQPKNLIEHMQNAEYTFCITIRHAFAAVNGLYVTPGPFSFYRRSIIDELGGFRFGHQTEDMEMALRIQQAGYEIENAPRARVYTKVPNTLLKLVRQRTRWTTGGLRNILGEYRGLILNRKYGALGMVTLPYALAVIAGTVVLFPITLFQLIRNVIPTLPIRSGVPLSYYISPHYSGFDWFYLLANMSLLLSLTMIVSTFFLTLFGRSVSKTAMTLTMGFISSSLIYGFIAPLWLLQATSDVVLRRRHHWR